MIDPLKSKNLPYFKALSNKRKRAFIALTIENITLHFWRIFFWIIFSFGLWMIGIPELFGKAAQIITTIIFIIGVIYLFKKDILSFKFPDPKELDHTLEKQSQFQQGHISFLEDELANNDKKNTRKLWDNAKIDILHSLTQIKAPQAKPILSREDPSALRFIAILIFISGIFISGNQWQDRIWQGLTPISIPHAIKQTHSAKLWITPPDYTQIAQIHVIGSDKTVFDIPENSKIKARIHNIFGKNIPPYLNNIKMNYLEDGLYELETTINEGDSIAITQAFIPRARWYYNLIKDYPPEINNNPSKSDNNIYEITDNYEIRIPLIVKDDYSVKELMLTMRLDEMIEDTPLGSTHSETRLIMSQPNLDFKIEPIYDLTWHIWAGLPVIFEYEVIDHKGQTSKLEKIELILPERKFKHPLARSLIEIRKRLAWDYKNSFLEHAKNLETLLTAPKYFQNNISAYLAVRTASLRLYYANNYHNKIRVSAAKEVIKLLWDTAITIEDGDLSLAMRDMRDAQKRLENALRDPNSSEDEISNLMDELRNKMAEYFTELQREMQKNSANGAELPEFSADNFNQIISPDILAKLMQEIENAMREGNTQKAQDLMSKLQRMMEMMDKSMAQGLPKDMQKMREGINELKELIDKQESLLEQTKDNYSPTPNKTEQEALRYVLGQLMLDVAEEIDDIPEAMGLAEQEMRLSANALGENAPRKSSLYQEKTIEYLNESQEEFNQQFKARMKQIIGIGLSGAGQRHDPLGRPYGSDGDQNGDSFESDVLVPDEIQKKRVDQILKDLRDRSGDRSLSDETLEYFRRLLRQF